LSGRAATWEGQTPEALERRWNSPQVHLHVSIDSTNNRAKELANCGAPGGTVVLTDEQTAGRGLETRRWHSPRGAGLYLSIILKPESAPNPLLIPLFAGLGVAIAVERLLDGVHVGVKWPNDVIVTDRKAGGVLSEAAWAGRTPHYVVVGVGVNVHQAADDFPEALRPVAISLDMAAGRTVPRLELADLVVSEVRDHCRVLPETLDHEFMRQFNQHDWLRQRRCEVETPDAPRLRGRAMGIAPDGALLIQSDRGALERVSSGRVLVVELPVPDY
jgi:BirA family biotin operon repressor/biotin-[acetyl-CoA-carboxylase] ligase